MQRPQRCLPKCKGPQHVGAVATSRDGSCTAPEVVSGPGLSPEQIPCAWCPAQAPTVPSPLLPTTGREGWGGGPILPAAPHKQVSVIAPFQQQLFLSRILLE